MHDYASNPSHRLIYELTWTPRGYSGHVFYDPLEEHAYYKSV